ncbi:MAG: serine--tRNA ligase [Candidatus Woesebacteria bacterium]|jgi:seryl-tRNA synthetase
MLDIRYVRENADRVQQAAQQKGYAVDVQKLLKLDDKRRSFLQKIEDLRRERNELAASLKQGRPDPQQIERGKALKTELADLEESLRGAEKAYLDALKQVPNMPLDEVPVGASEDENVVSKEWGTPKKFDFEPKNHWQIAEARDWIDKKRAAKVAGARFAYIKGDLVKLQWALFTFAMTRLTNPDVIKQIIANNNLSVSSKPFVPVLPPLMIRTEVYDAMDRLEPRDDRYKIEGEDQWLQGSAEHVLGSMHLDEIFDESELPLRYLGYATSFRREAGSYGKDMEGIFRLHQFDKMEMESLATSQSSLEEHKFMVAIQEYLMQQLELPYRVIMKCTADIGKPNARGVDIDVWLPGQNKYRETHTADFMTDYQARRLQTRVRRSDGEIEYVHTNDATVFSQRPLIAIIENYQNHDGTVTVPQVLRHYMSGRETI